MDHLQPARVDPRKQALLEARFGGRNKVSPLFRVRCCQMVYFQTKKKTIWVNFERSCNGRCWQFLWSFCLFYGQTVHFMAIWYMLWPFGIF
jgi:hypothetical protein